MSGSKKSNSETGSRKKMGSESVSLADRLKKSLSCDEEKSDGKPNLGSPVSTLGTGFSSSSSSSSSSTTTAAAAAATSTTTSSSSTPSASGRNVSFSVPRKSDSGKGSSKSSPTARGHKSNRPEVHSSGSSGKGSVKPTSPARNELPPCGNLFPSGVVMTTGMASKPVCTELNPGGAGHYGYGSVIRDQKSGGVSQKSGGGGVTDSKNDVEEFKMKGNESYGKGYLLEALNLYDKAIAISRDDATLHCNRAAVLIDLKRFGEAMKECEEAIRLSPMYVEPHHRLASLLLSFGQVESARRHFFSLGRKPDQAEFQKLRAVERHIIKCTDARRLEDWTTMLKEAEAAISSGAETSPQLFACKAEAYLKLHQLRDAGLWIHKARKAELSTSSSQSKLFGMFSEAYIFLVEAQVETANRRFDNARTAIERAAQVDLLSAEVTALLRTMRLVGRARSRGNELFKSARYREALAAYGEGLLHDSSNPVLYCNRAACWYKLEQWEKCLDDCNHALRSQPYYTKALQRKATSNVKLERWAEAVKDYEALRRELPSDTEIAESLFNAQVALKKSRGEDASNMKFGGKVELISNLEKFRAATASSGASVIHFKAESNPQCRQISSFFDILSTKFPLVSFFKVDVERSPIIAAAENITKISTFKIYKNGSRVMEMFNPSREMLQASVTHYSL